MRLATWAALKGWGALKWLERESGVSYGTIHKLARGGHRASPDTALAIERATGGAVTAMELMVPDDLAHVGPKRKRDQNHGNTQTRATRANHGPHEQRQPPQSGPQHTD